MNDSHPPRNKSCWWHPPLWQDHTLDYLSLCETNGIVINKDKFQFCQDIVQFGGLQITPTGVTPSNNLLNTISSFPSPKNITDARSWFGLVNQVAWAYSLSPIMLPFRELVKKNSNFVWNESLEKAFQQSEQVIVGLVKKGVTTFDINRTTCLEPDITTLAHRSNKMRCCSFKTTFFGSRPLRKTKNKNKFQLP